MATKKTARPKKKATSRDKKGASTATQFKIGNKAAEKWTEATVMPYVKKMWLNLVTDEHGKIPKNIFRANDIKLQGEAAIISGVKKVWWDNWKAKFLDGPVYDAIKEIEFICENRLKRSGTTMDIFLLKANYGHRETSNVDMTTNGESMNNPFLEFLKLTSAKKQNEGS